jgi:nucleoside phosphorylase
MSSVPATNLSYLRVEDYTVGWICALPLEFKAAIVMLDERYGNTEDNVQYTLGRVGKHNVVMGCLPKGQYGTNSAAMVATEMRLKFPGLQFGLMVGIGGGIPSKDVRLGDVVISAPEGNFGGVVQYDFGKTGRGGLTRTGYLNAPPPVLLSALSSLQADPEAVIKIMAHLPQDSDEFDRQNAGPDVLYQAFYDHAGGSTCDQCSKDMMVSRKPREKSMIHYGTIASGNQVMKDGVTRDKISTELGGILCFEMEAAGLMNSFPSLVIRGICGKLNRI